MFDITHAPPVSPEAETALIVQAQDGDQDATMALVSQHIRRMASLARRWSWAADIEDLTIAAMEGFLVALRLHDADGRRLWTFAHTRVLEEVRRTALGSVGVIDVPWSSLRAHQTGGLSTSTSDSIAIAMEAVASYDRCPELRDSLAEVLDTPNMDPSSWAVIRDLVDRALAAQTSERDRDVLRHAYGFAKGYPMTDVEVAQELGISSRTMAERIRRRGLERARAALNVEVSV